MSDLGYLRKKANIYRAEWSLHDVEHFLYIEMWGKPKQFLAVDFGFRNPPSWIFAIMEIRKYGGEIFQDMKPNDPYPISNSFSLGRFAGWPYRDSLSLFQLSGTSLQTKLKIDIENRLFPIIRPLFNIDRLLEFLLIDAEPCPWWRSAAGIRAAQIAHLARRVGWRDADIREALRPFEKPIIQSMPRTVPNPAAYLDSIISDSVDVTEDINRGAQQDRLDRV
jgi:hypothetical protein